jgi:hypothetical protein
MLKTSIGLLSDQEINDTKIILDKIIFELKNINGDPPYRLELFFEDFPISSGFIDIPRINKIIILLNNNDIIFYEKPFMTRQGNRGIHIAILEDKEKITSLYNEIEKIPVSLPKTKVVTSAENTTNNKLLITKDGRGNYYYNGILMNMNPDTYYYKLFDVLYTEKDQFGFLSYAEIDKQLVKRGLENINDLKKQRIRIFNILNQQLFRNTKINNKPLINSTLDKQKLIDRKRGKGLILNNPTIN